MNSMYGCGVDWNFWRVRMGQQRHLYSIYNGCTGIKKRKRNRRMRATLHEQLFLLGVAGVVSYICWNCRIASSTIILIVVLCAFLFACVCPGMESFAEGPSVAINYSTLMDAGVIRPSVFNCASTIGNTAEESYMYADPTKDM